MKRKRDKERNGDKEMERWRRKEGDEEKETETDRDHACKKHQGLALTDPYYPLSLCPKFCPEVKTIFSGFH